MDFNQKMINIYGIAHLIKYMHLMDITLNCPTIDDFIIDESLHPKLDSFNFFTEQTKKMI